MAVIGITPGENYMLIKEIYAFISSDDKGEGVVSAMIGGMMMPFVCADKARVASLMPIAKKIVKETGEKIKLIKLSVREDIEDI